MERRTVLEGIRLTTGYGKGRRAAEVHTSLNFSLRSGELTCLLGCNGAGKSTLLRTLAGMQPPLSGRLNVMGRASDCYSGHERSKTIGVVLTDRMQAGGLTVYELVALGRQPYTGFFGRLSRSDKGLITRALHDVGMEHKSRCYVAELSDGERQKAMIAKVLVQECPLILLDEPTAFLDVESRIEVMKLLRRLATKENKAVLLSTHDTDQALAMADRLWLMTQEREMVCGVTEELVLSGWMDKLFGGDSIRFDRMRGVYAPDNDGRQAVSLTATDETLRYWVQNLLVRKGFRVVLSNEGIVSAISLTVNSGQNMSLRQGGETEIVRSFDELSEMLDVMV